MSTTDTFTRADSTTSLGNADTGEAWTAVVGTWGINTNQAYEASPGSGDAAVLDAGAADGTFQCDLLFRDAGDGVVFRHTGVSASSGFLVYLDTSNLNVLVPGFGSHLTGSPVTLAHTAGTTYTLKVVLSGTSIQVYENNVLKLSATSATNQTATKYGLRSGGTTATKRWDNLSFVPAGGGGGGGGTPGREVPRGVHRGVTRGVA